MTLHRLTPRTHSQSASELSQAETPAHTPALLHSRWTAPQVARVCWAKASTSWALDTSVTTASTGAPVACRAAAVAVKASPSTSANTTFIPSCAHRSARARPMPLAAPVITATLSLNSFMVPPHVVQVVTCMEPNAGAEPPPKAGARRRLEGVGSSALFGPHRPRGLATALVYAVKQYRRPSSTRCRSPDRSRLPQRSP